MATRTDKREKWTDATRIALLEEDMDSLESKVVRRLNVALTLLVTLNVAALTAIAGWAR